MTAISAFAVLRNLVPVCFLVTCLAAAGCSGIDSADGQPSRPAREVIPPPSVTGVAGCFLVVQAQDFRVLDRSNLIVYAPDERHAYHVQIGPPSQDLRNAESLTFMASTGRICGFAGERLVIGGSAGTRTGPPINVIAVSKLSTEGLKLLRAGSAAPPPVEPRPGPGPEIEGLPDSDENPDPAKKAEYGTVK